MENYRKFSFNYHRIPSLAGLLFGFNIDLMFSLSCIADDGYIRSHIKIMFKLKLYKPRHEKTCLRGLRPGKTQTGLQSFRD